VAFGFFLFIVIAIPVIAPVSGSTFVERAGIGLTVAVFASIGVLLVIRKYGR
jgi:hypothetical protein